MVIGQQQIMLKYSSTKKVSPGLNHFPSPQDLTLTTS